MTFVTASRSAKASAASTSSARVPEARSNPPRVMPPVEGLTFRQGPVASDAASSGVVLNTVAQLNHTILEAFDGVQIQGHVTVAPRYQWNAVPNEHRGHSDDELVDRVFVKKG